MKNFRTYGRPPFHVAVVHGGPGAAGDVAPVAQRLGLHRGVLEPLQTVVTLDGQVEELRQVLLRHATLPITLIGHSWGAWLVVVLAARFPDMAGKLILVGSGPFEDQYAAGINARRMQRLSAVEASEYRIIVDSLNTGAPGAEELVPRLGALAAKADSFAPMESDEPAERLALPATPAQVYAGVWPAAARLRSSGELLALAGRLACPVVALHGDSDPHPVAGVQESLARVVKDCRMIVLEKCGHTPWREQYAVEKFYELLEQEI
jgi:pimeloyl-ACP methyl ester carboxylesterase